MLGKLVDDLVPLLLLAAILIGFAIYLAHRYRKEFIVFEYQRGLLFKNGELQNVVDGGRYRRWGLGWSIQILDLRPVTSMVAFQEILTRDGLTVKISIAARYAVVDPKSAILNSQDYRTEVYQEVQVAMRDVVTPLTADEVLTQRVEIAERVGAMTAGKFESVGLKLDKLNLRDIVFPGELRRAMAQVALAQKESLAALERARGETAALRSLANAAKMLEGNPALLQLRMLQAIGEGKSGTIVLNTTGHPVNPTA